MRPCGFGLPGCIIRLRAPGTIFKTCMGWAGCAGHARVHIIGAIGVITELRPKRPLRLCLCVVFKAG